MEAVADKPLPTPGFVNRWVDFLVMAFPLVLIITGAVSYYSFDLARNLKLNANIISLMPDGVPSVDNLQKVIDKTGGYSNAMVLVESPDVDAALNYLEDFRELVLVEDWVTTAEYSEDVSILERNKLIFVDAKDLREINRRIANRMDYEKKNLEFEINGTPVEINIRGSKAKPAALAFDDIERKYGGGGSGDKNGKNRGKKLFANDAQTLFVLAILPKGSSTNVNYAREIIAKLKTLIERSNPKAYHPELEVFLGGRVTNLVSKFEAAMNDVKGSVFWAVSGILLAVMLFYRRFMAIFYVGVPLFVGAMWTFGLTQIMLGGLNLITIFLVVILFGLGIDFGIHNLARYDEVRRGGGSMTDALRIIYSRTGKASVWAGLTTIAGFFSLLLTDFRAFSEFGFIAGSGVALTLVSMYLVFPALMIFAERIHIYRVQKPRNKPADRENRGFPLPKTTIALGLALTAGAAMLIPDIQFERDFGNLKTDVPEVSRLNDKIREVFPLRSDKAVVFVENLEDVSPLVNEVERIRLSRPPEEATIEKVKSIYSVVPKIEDQEERLKIINQINGQLLEARRLLEDFGEGQEERKREIEDLLTHFGVSTLAPADLPPALRRVYTGTAGSGGYLVYIYNKEGVSNLDDAQAFVDDIREIHANGKTFYPATEAMVFVDMLNLMKNDAGSAILLVVLAVALMLVIAFRSLGDTLLAMIPVVVGVTWMLGAMVALDMKLNIFNMVVLPTVLGIGIDNAIHIFHRYKEDTARIFHTIKTTGGAAFLTTFTTMLGFAGTITATNQGLQSLGWAACIGLGCCMVSSLTIFPATLQLLENRREKRIHA